MPLRTISDDAILFSPEKGIISGPISFDRPGEYKFYLYSDGAGAEKTVNVADKKEFEIGMELPVNASIAQSFLSIVHVKNLASGSKSAVISLYYGDVHEIQYLFQPGEEKTFAFNLTPASLGMGKVSAAAMAGSISSYTSQIYIYQEEKKGILDTIYDFFAGIIGAISKFFSGGST